MPWDIIKPFEDPLRIIMCMESMTRVSKETDDGRFSDLVKMDLNKPIETIYSDEFFNNFEKY